MADVTESARLEGPVAAYRSTALAFVSQLLVVLPGDTKAAGPKDRPGIEPGGGSGAHSDAWESNPLRRPSSGNHSAAFEM